MSGLREATKNADVAQSVEYILGKDEVVGSIPIVSSIKTLNQAYKARFKVFLFFLSKMRNHICFPFGLFFGVMMCYFDIVVIIWKSGESCFRKTHIFSKRKQEENRGCLFAKYICLKCIRYKNSCFCVCDKNTKFKMFVYCGKSSCYLAHFGLC